MTAPRSAAPGSDAPNLPTSRLLRRLVDELTASDLNRTRRTLRPLPATGRHVHRAGRRLLNLASNDYLGLATDPRLIDAAVAATRQLGTGGTASRLVTGHLDLHAEAERAFARFKHAEAGLLLPTGYTANLAVLTTLCRAGDGIFCDKLSHASLLDAGRASPATFRTYAHRDLGRLNRLLDRFAATRSHRDRQAFIVTDTVFSMDGDCADLPALLDLARRHDAVLVVDEAHGTGILGESGAGLAEHQGVAGQIDITISTASKALGGLGGLITAAGPVIDTLIHRARPLIYTTASPPAVAATLLAALETLHDQPQRRQRLAAISRHVRDHLPARHAGPSTPTDPPTPIVPLITGTAESAEALAAAFETRGFATVAIRPPTVAPGSSRVRLCLRADLTDDEVTRLVETISTLS